MILNGLKLKYPNFKNKIMNQETINAKLDDLLNSPKTKNYLNHLVQQYIPIKKCSTVYEEPSKNFICTLTNKQLLSGKQSSNSNAKLVEPISALPDDEQLALTGNNTTTYMSYKAYKMFYDWVVNKLTSGNKHISWLLGDINRTEFVNNYKGIETKPFNTNKDKNYSKPKTERANFTLGDLDVLQELKKKMNS